MHNFKMLRPVDQQYQIKIWTHDYNSIHFVKNR